MRSSGAVSAAATAAATPADVALTHKGTGTTTPHDDRVNDDDDGDNDNDDDGGGDECESNDMIDKWSRHVLRMPS